MWGQVKSALLILCALTISAAPPACACPGDHHSQFAIVEVAPASAPCHEAEIASPSNANPAASTNHAAMADPGAASHVDDAACLHPEDQPVAAQAKSGDTGKSLPSPPVVGEPAGFMLANAQRRPDAISRNFRIRSFTPLSPVKLKVRLLN